MQDKKFRRKALLAVAGYDPTSGAGAVLDIRVFQHLGFQGMGILTALTVQNTQRVSKFQCVAPDILWEQASALFEDISFAGIKVGMIGCRENIGVVKKILSQDFKIPKVIDPVFRSSSGMWLLPRKAISEFSENLFGKATCLTPNIAEASLLSGIRIRHNEDMKLAAEKIHSLWGAPCLIKGGHLPHTSTDVLFDGKGFHVFEGINIDKKVHGTGCFFSSSLLGFLSKGNPLKEACCLAKELTLAVIKKAVPLGHGQHLITFPFSRLPRP